MTKEEIKEFKKLIKWAKKNGVAEFDPTTGAFKMHSPLSVAPKIESGPKTKSKDQETDPALLIDDPNAGMPADGDLLYWSTDAFDLITETRKETEPRN